MITNGMDCNKKKPKSTFTERHRKLKIAKLSKEAEKLLPLLDRRTGEITNRATKTKNLQVQLKVARTYYF